MTEALFHKDGYCQEFTATVVAADTVQQAVALDRTAFYQEAADSQPTRAG